jgi:hypothetical protein
MRTPNKGIERDAGIAVILFCFSLCAPAPLMHVVLHISIGSPLSLRFGIPLDLSVLPRVQYPLIHIGEAVHVSGQNYVPRGMVLLTVEYQKLPTSPAIIPEAPDINGMNIHFDCEVRSSGRTLLLL